MVTMDRWILFWDSELELDIEQMNMYMRYEVCVVCDEGADRR